MEKSLFPFDEDLLANCQLINDAEGSEEFLYLLRTFITEVLHSGASCTKQQVLALHSFPEFEWLLDYKAKWSVQRHNDVVAGVLYSINPGHPRY